MVGQEQLEGEVERLVYSSGESGFTFWRCLNARMSTL